MRLLGLSLLLACALSAATPQELEFFEKRIRPVLAEKCYACHSAETMALGELRVDAREAIRRGGTRGPAVAPGDPENSVLLKAISYGDLDLKMPPTGKLPEEEIAAFRQWIEIGAPDPRAEAVAKAPAAPAGIDWEAAREFWSFQPVRRPAEPSAGRYAEQVATPVDAFLLARLEREGLEPAPLADKRTLIRRVSYDLTGLPPTPEELESFLADPAPDAYEKLVERLLASPHYGERWARHWLDLMRFAETNGHEFDNTKLDAWRYRDYVVHAFNEDLPYDRFVKEHIAGDLLPDPRLRPDGKAYDTPVAAGFYWLWEVLNSPTDSEKARADQVDNQIDVFGKAFFGLTVACARCHDHKFDPIPTADYYALAGVMHSTHISEKWIDSPERRAAIQAVRDRLVALDREARTAPRPEALPPAPARDNETVFEDFSQGYGRWDIAGAAFGAEPSQGSPALAPLAGDLGGPLAHSAPAGAAELTGILTTEKFQIPSTFVHIRMAGTKGDKRRKESEPIRVTLWADDHPSQNMAAPGEEGFEWVTVRLVKEKGRVGYFQIVDRSREGWIAVDRIVFSEHAEPPADPPAPAAGAPPAPELLARRDAVARTLPPSEYAMSSRDHHPHDVRIHQRGNHKNLGEEVPRRFLQIVAGPDQPPVADGSGRLELAAWAASPQNPLTARVLVNRVWQHHFGEGLVRSPDNFGQTGDRPTHPELLDWLAADFMEHGWSVKHLHRRILLSSAYRRQSAASDRAREVDPANKLLSHMPVRRLEAEAIRDAVLAVAGTLRLELGGPSVPPHISAYQDGRGKPESGPLDGDGRRSIYIQPRRNFLTPLFLAFDYPQPFTTIGRRGVSAVPSQALMLLNNELIQDQAGKWAQRELEVVSDPDRRIADMYLRALGRPPSARELRQIRAFLAQQADRHGAATASDQRPWADLAHVLFNTTEFIFVP
ncbi:MAG: DUF1553 domain-containing protein [Acidobacteria bacterium]|nr:DUF1553 domain-containing protein [Acidobacteriota bacterium]